MSCTAAERILVSTGAAVGHSNWQLNTSAAGAAACLFKQLQVALRFNALPIQPGAIDAAQVHDVGAHACNALHLSQPAAA